MLGFHIVAFGRINWMASLRGLSYEEVSGCFTRIE